MNKFIKRILSTMFIVMCLSFFLIIKGVNLYSQNIPIDVEKVLIEMDSILNFGKESGSFSANVSMLHKDADGKEEIRTSILYRKDGRDKMMTIFTSPLSRVGSGYLSIENNLWYYDAGSGEWVRKTRRERYAGTNVETKDLEKNKYRPEYNWEYAGEDKVGKVNCYILNGTAKFEDMPYPKQKVWIRQDNYLPLKEEAYAVSGVLQRTAYMVHYIKLLDEKDQKHTYVDDKRLIVNNIEKTQSVREFTNISLKELPDNMFTKAYFETQSKKN